MINAVGNPQKLLLLGGSSEIGLAICAIGVALCFTIIGAIIGIPLIIFGGGLMLKCIF